MAAKKSLPDRVQLKGLDSLFGIDQEQTGQVLDVPIRELFPFQNHPLRSWMMKRWLRQLKVSVRTVSSYRSWFVTDLKAAMK